MPASTDSATAIGPGNDAGKAAPHTAVTNEPAASCPSAPMLNRPTLNATETASPVRISGVVLNSTWPIP